MQKHYNYLDIDLDSKIYRKLNAVQGDIKSRYILVNLYSNNLSYDLTSCTVRIYGIKKDKTIFFNNASIKDAKKGQFEIELTNQALAVAGELEIQVLVMGTNGERLTSSAFFIAVGESIVDEDAIESANEFGALTESLSKVDEWDEYFEETSGKIEEKYTERLNQHDEQFNQVEQKKLDKNGTVTMANMGQDVKEAMTGGSVAVVGVDAVRRENIVDGEVTIPKFSQEISNGLGVVTNILQNSNFDTGQYWSENHSTRSVAENKLSIIGTSTSRTSEVYQTALHSKNEGKYFAKCDIKIGENVERIRISVTTSSKVFIIDNIENPIAGDYVLKGIVDVDEDITRFNITITYPNTTISNGSIAIAYRPLLININNYSDFTFDNILTGLSVYPNMWFSEQGILLNNKTFQSQLSSLKNEMIELSNKKNNSYPVSDFEYFKTFKGYHEPTSIGVDGFVYGALGNGSSTIFRTGDAFESIEVGFDFKTLDSRRITYVTKSNAGYVVVISDLAIHTTGFYFSKSFTDGFEKVAEMYTGHIRLWNVGKQELDYGLGLLLFGGYGATNTVKELIMSRDGGETYTTIHTLEPIQGQERCHYHASTFDRLTGRIYTSIGDIANAKVIYSDDFGSKWTEIPNTLPTPLQTTSLVNLANKLVLCPDRDGYYASIWTMTKGETSTINEIPKFDLAFNKKIANIKAQYQYVGYPFVVSNSGIECYVPFMDFGANNKTIYIVATNDGGETWHTILVDNYNDKFTANTFGILGYDKNGNLYMKYQGNNPEIRIFKGITWSNYRFANETNYELT